MSELYVRLKIMKTTIKYFVGISATIAGSILLVLLVAGQNSHNFNLKYRLWKIGFIEYDTDRFTRFLGADDNLRMSMRGKTVEETEEIFGDLKSISESNDYQQEYTYGKSAEDFYWIGESRWGVQFKAGKLERFTLSKG